MNNAEFDRYINDIGIRLFRIREDAGISRNQLQKKTGIHHNTIMNYENGVASPTLRLLAAIADGIGYDIRVEFVKRSKRND